MGKDRCIGAGETDEGNGAGEIDGGNGDMGKRNGLFSPAATAAATISGVGEGGKRWSGDVDGGGGA